MWGLGNVGVRASGWRQARGRGWGLEAAAAYERPAQEQASGVEEWESGRGPSDATTQRAGLLKSKRVGLRKGKMGGRFGRVLSKRVNHVENEEGKRRGGLRMQLHNRRA